MSWFQTKSQAVWILSWKSATKMKYSSAWNYCITSKKSKGEKTKRQTHSLQNSHQNVWRKQSPKCVHAWMKFLKSRDICFQHYTFSVRDDNHLIVHVYARFWKISGFVWFRPDIFCTITYHYNYDLFMYICIYLLFAFLFWKRYSTNCLV